MARVAFLTFSILRETRDHPQVKGFFDRLPAAYLAAEASDGYIDRARLLDLEKGETSWGEWAVSRFFDPEKHGGAPRTLSLWEDVESVYAFSYSGLHGEALRGRLHWFLKPDWPSYAMWWVDDDYVPNWLEAAKRHERLHDDGASHESFDFRSVFDATGNQVPLNRDLVKQKIERNRLTQKGLG